MNNTTNKIIKTVIGFGFGLILVGLLILSWNWKKLPPELPWFFSLPWGEGQLISKTHLLITFTLAMLTWAVFSYAVQKVRKEDAEVTVTLLLGGLVAIILAIVSLLKVLSIFTKWSF